MLNSKREGVYYKNGAFLPAREGPAAGLPAMRQSTVTNMARVMGRLGENRPSPVPVNSSLRAVKPEESSP